MIVKKDLFVNSGLKKIRAKRELRDYDREEEKRLGTLDQPMNMERLLLQVYKVFSESLT